MSELLLKSKSKTKLKCQILEGHLKLYAEGFCSKMLDQSAELSGDDFKDVHREEDLSC